MGAVPKRKISKARKNRRRAHDSLEAPALAVCPKCNQTKRPHFKCPNCGHYGGAAKKQKAQKNKSKSKNSASAKKDSKKPNEKKK
jgi:large subunit ribosomal protein L32